LFREKNNKYLNLAFISQYFPADEGKVPDYESTSDIE